MALRYKFVEVAKVSAAALEDTVNRWIGEGWQLDAIRFVTGEAAKRPKLAFVSFVRDDDGERAEAVDLPVVSSIRRRTRIIELGELDLGDAEPFEAELDWANAESPPPAEPALRRGRAAPGAGRRRASRSDPTPPPAEPALRRGRAAPGAGRPRASRSDPTLPPAEPALRRGRAAPGAGRPRASRSDQK